mmetsp:Transcript_46529/g.123552  ORF Transcript_46529/g.123552 Transcript_46529/m.123552 type:complete len:274 (-) Transcript_46529:284-1105(-)
MRVRELHLRKFKVQGVQSAAKSSWKVSLHDVRHHPAQTAKEPGSAPPCKSWLARGISVIGGRGTPHGGTSAHRGEPLLLRGAVHCPFHPAVDGFVRASLLNLARNLCGLSPLVQRDAVWIQLSGIPLVAESRHDAKLFLVHCELVPTIGGRVTRLEDLVGLVLVTRLARFITVLIQQEAPKWDSFVHPMAVRISETSTPMLLPRHQGVLLATRFRRTRNGGIHLKRPVGFLHLGLVARHRLPLHDEELVAWNDELRDDCPTFSVTDRQLVSIA